MHKTVSMEKTNHQMYLQSDFASNNTIELHSSALTTNLMWNQLFNARNYNLG